MAASRPLCAFHAGCNDGFTAAWVVHRAHEGGVDLHEGRYGDPPPDATDRDVILVDFSYPREAMDLIAAQARSVVLLDHHETAVKHLEGWPESRPNVTAVLDQRHAGCLLAWDFYHQGETPPWLVQYVEDRDLWAFDLPHTAEYIAVVSSHDHQLGVWDVLAMTGIGQVIEEGRSIVRRDRHNINAIVRYARPMTIGAYRVPVANSPYGYGSDVAGLLAQGKPFAGYYFDDAEHRQFGLRSTAEGLNVAEVAERYGGGGHPHAAGFRVPRDHELAAA